MSFSGDIRVNQNGLVPSARTLTNATPLDVAIVNGVGDQLTGFDASRPATAALTQVPKSTSSVTILAANAARRGGSIYNNSNRDMWIALAATASTTAFTTKLPPNGFWKFNPDDYTGIITAVWAAGGSGDAQVTELTA